MSGEPTKPDTIEQPSALRAMYEAAGINGYLTHHAAAEIAEAHAAAAVAQEREKWHIEAVPEDKQLTLDERLSAIAFIQSHRARAERAETALAENETLVGELTERVESYETALAAVTAERDEMQRACVQATNELIQGAAAMRDTRAMLETAHGAVHESREFLARVARAYKQWMDAIGPRDSFNFPKDAEEHNGIVAHMHDMMALLVEFSEKCPPTKRAPITGPSAGADTQ